MEKRKCFTVNKLLRALSDSFDDLAETANYAFTSADRLPCGEQRTAVEKAASDSIHARGILMGGLDGLVQAIEKRDKRELVLALEHLVKVGENWPDLPVKEDRRPVKGGYWRKRP